VRRVEDIQAIFDRMYEQLDAPRFKVRQTVCEGSDAFLIWELEFRLRGRAKSESIRGVSHVRFGAHGKVSWHRDYWDTSEELYQKIPLLGAGFRWLRRRGG
jgi:steroid delta-isomerase